MMCLAFPGKVKEVEKRQIVVEYPQETRKALLGDTPVKVGDWVLVQMGVVVNILSEEEAKTAQKAWGQVS